jgi:hypothetical protein
MATAATNRESVRWGFAGGGHRPARRERWMAPSARLAGLQKSKCLHSAKGNRNHVRPAYMGPCLMEALCAGRQHCRCFLFLHETFMDKSAHGARAFLKYFLRSDVCGMPSTNPPTTNCHCTLTVWRVKNT